MSAGRVLRPCWLLLALAACGDDDGGGADAFVGDAGPCVPGADTLFADDFDDATGPPFVPDYDALPLALFPDDGSRWTQIQNSHEGQNRMAVIDARGGRALQCFAAGQAEGVASKMDVGRQGFDFVAGDRLRLTASFLAQPGGSILADNTLLDLEDNDDLRIDGESTGAGLRIRTDAEGRVTLDRGEIPGREAPGEPAVVRLSSLRSDYVLPVGEWVELEVTLQLGVDVARSTATVDDFDADATAAWVEIRTRTDGDTESRLVLRMAGSNMLDPVALREVVERDAPDTELSIDEPIDLDSFQVGATNNRSLGDVTIVTDDVRVERLRRCR